ncbi:MAG: 16S rRNA (cytidine(1402)-2'-O)-methyltransferase [Rickettsiales bacterium]
MPSTKPVVKSQSGTRGELFLVATPIGNLGDITLRALETLKKVDRIACEDTRTSGTLLTHYGIKVPLTPYHTHNEAEATAQLVDSLVAGARIALISDAGTPLLSDPGARLVKAAVAANIRVTPIPGASALLSAITIAGLPAEQFYYAGFLPSKTTARTTALTALATIPATLVFYEAPHRLLETLDAIRTTLGDRESAVARELTKLYEECIRGTITDIITHYEANPPRGECVILIHGAAPKSALTDSELDDALRSAMETMSVKEAVAQTAKHSGRAKSDVYARALIVKGDA